MRLCLVGRGRRKRCTAREEEEGGRRGAEAAGAREGLPELGRGQRQPELGRCCRSSGAAREGLGRGAGEAFVHDSGILFLLDLWLSGRTYMWWDRFDHMRAVPGRVSVLCHTRQPDQRRGFAEIGTAGGSDHSPPNGTASLARQMYPPEIWTLKCLFFSLMYRLLYNKAMQNRSEERRVGKEC